MPISAEGDVLVDTSVAVALLVSDHEHHATVATALADTRLGLAGHAAFETFSVMTRLPAPLRRTPRATGRMLAHNFPGSVFLDDGATAGLLQRLPELGIGGGAVYDALVGGCAAHHGVALATRDRRALAVYRILDVDVQLIE